jgi:thioredoxin-like negative regulator of GroEL
MKPDIDPSPDNHAARTILALQHILVWAHSAPLSRVIAAASHTYRVEAGELEARLLTVLAAAHAARRWLQHDRGEA